MTIRHHPITGEPILFAPERAERPRAFGNDPIERCPFCPGNESDTPPEIARVGDPWQVRVFPNKFPPVEGAEVIVESRYHNLSFETLGTGRNEIVRMYVERYRAHADAVYVSIFKNDGARAGASIDHVHSQLIPLPFLPPRIAREGEAFARAAHCPLCAIAGTEIGTSPAFRWLTPDASWFPYQQWILPKRHISELSELNDAELDDLALLLISTAYATRAEVSALNWMFMSFPRNPAGHFYVDVVPRLTAIPGFELGTGTFVEIIDPAAAAHRLRAT